jgi:hypothetical protein
MKTAGKENPNRRVAGPCNRAHGAAGQNRSRSIKWAEKQEKFQPKEMCFFLHSPFIELTRSLAVAPVFSERLKHEKRPGPTWHEAASDAKRRIERAAD